MAVYTDVTPAEVERLLADYDIGALAQLQGIAAGVVNSNFFLDTTRQRYVLTVFETLSAHELPYFLDLTAYLAARGVPCPRPIPARDGTVLRSLQGKPAAIVQCLSGASVAHPDAHSCARAGAALARLHLAGRGFPRRRPNPLGFAWMQRCRESLAGAVSPAELGLLDTEIAHLGGQDFTAAPNGVIHGDLFQDNVLFEAGEVSGIIDFYYACDDALLFDLAITVNDWCAGAAGDLDAALTRAMLGAYRALRPVSTAEIALWPAMLQAAAMRFWLSRLLDHHFPRQGSLTTIKDPDEYKHILLQRRAATAALAAMWEPA